MKHDIIKKRWITEGAVIISTLVVLGGTLYFIVTTHDNYEQEKGNLQTQVAMVTNERQTLENKYQKIQQNMDLYRELMDKSQNDGLSVDRQTLRNKIEDFKTRYFLNDLSITMGVVKDLTGPQYQYKSSQMVVSDLTVEFDTLADEDIFNFLQSLQTELPGGLKIGQFSIKRESKVTDEALRAIAKNGRYSMVKGKAQFTWMGIKSLEPETPENKKAAP